MKIACAAATKPLERSLAVKLHAPVMRVLSKNPSLANRCYVQEQLCHIKSYFGAKAMVGIAFVVSPDRTTNCFLGGLNDSIRCEPEHEIAAMAHFSLRMANRGRGKRMRRPVTRLTLLAAAAAMATGCVPVRHNLPPEQRLLEPGPGVGGPGPGVLGPIPMAPGGPMMGGPMMGGPGMGGPMMGGQMMGGPGMGGPMMGGPGMSGPMMDVPGVGGPEMGGPMMSPSMPMNPQGPPMATTDDQGNDIALTNFQCGINGGGYSDGSGVMMTAGMLPAVPPTVQVTLGKPESMQIRYDVTGSGQFDSEPLIVPARQNFPQGGLYRLKLTNIVNREGVELYPTMELAYANPRTGAYLAHNSIPVQFTEEDFDQVLTGNFVTKVIYLPDPDYQGPALAGIDTLVSTRLDPGMDPIVEADRRGSILAIIRLGDKDIEMAGGTDVGAAVGMGMNGGIAGMPMAFAPAMTEGCGCGGGPGGGNGNGNPMPPSLPGMIAGVTAPQYGMPMSGTPIGLPGPPHIPLGHPAGLKKHVIKNHTSMHIPRPVEDVKIGVRMAPGYSYPNPASRIHMTEQNINPGIPQGRPAYDKASQRVR
jgi:hypothetical protein